MFGLFNQGCNKCDKNEGMWIWFILILLLFSENDCNKDHTCGICGLQDCDCNYNKCNDNNGQIWIIFILLLFALGGNNNFFGI